MTSRNAIVPDVLPMERFALGAENGLRSDEAVERVESLLPILRRKWARRNLDALAQQVSNLWCVFTYESHLCKVMMVAR
jgi:hypothetical protein